MKEIELDINEKNLVLKAAKKYYLDISLPYKINSDEGGAKFDSKTKTLTVTLPTVPEDEKVEPKENGHAEEIETAQAEDNEDDQLESSNKESMLKFVNEDNSKKYKEGKLVSFYK